nr:hypothetical protein [uncultured Actinotalea sp.]
MTDLEKKPQLRANWPLILGVLFLVWGGSNFVTGTPSGIAFLVALLGIALIVVGLLRRPGR